jgi:8-oxo-dGTP pyrophosphatase MutT (NUDIX family)
MHDGHLLPRSSLRALPLRLASRSYVRVREAIWFFTRPETFGVRAIPVTAEGAVVLVRHTYLDGWYLPGGGRATHESPEKAALRELREEIGLIAHDEVRHLGELTSNPNFRRDTTSLFVVTGVTFAARHSLEIDAVAAFAPGALPADTRPTTRLRIEEWLDGRPPPPEW